MPDARRIAPEFGALSGEDAMARLLDHPQRQPPAREPRRAEGGRAPGELRLDGRPDVRALLPRAAARRTGWRSSRTPGRCSTRSSTCSGRRRREKLEAFRGWGGAQSYPSRTKDTDDVDFSTGSVGLGVAVTAFASLVQDYVRARGWADGPEGRMIAFVGDAELDEGNIYECLQEGWKHGLRNCWWIIDYNRQSLDGVVREGLSGRIAGIFEAFGWEVITLKYGALQRAAFAEPGGERAARLDRRLPEPALFGADLPGRRGLAGAADGRDRRPGAGDGAARPPVGRRARRADAEPRRALRRDHRRGLRPGGGGRPAEGDPRLHGQGLRHAARRPQGQPFRADDPGADGRVPGAHGRARGP